MAGGLKDTYPRLNKCRYCSHKHIGRAAPHWCGCSQCRSTGKWKIDANLLRVLQA